MAELTSRRKFLEEAPKDPERERWLALGGEHQIELPEDFKRPAKAPTFGSFDEARAYVESILPKVQADYGDNDRASYESERVRLQRAAASGALTEQERYKAQLLLGDLDNHYRAAAEQWYADDLRNAGSNEEAAAIQAKLDGLKQTGLSDTRSRMVADVMAGGTGFGDAGGWDGKFEQDNRDNIGADVWNEMIAGWNEKDLKDQYDAVGEQILNNTRIRNAQQLGYYDQGANRAITGLRDANDSATQQTQDAIRELEQSGGSTKEQIDALLSGLATKQASTDKRADASLKGVKDAFGRFTSERDAATKDYLESLTPLQSELQAKGYDSVQTSAADIGRLLDSFGKQQDVYGRYEELSTPEMTAKERAILDAAQRSYSLKDKAARDANIRDLSARGILSGGNLISNQVAAQQQLGNERVAATNAALGSAVDRALAALAGMRGTAADLSSSAGQIRTGNDAMAQFNKSQQGITERFQSEYAQAERERLAKLAQSRQDTVLNKTSGDFDASSSLNRDTQDALDRSFGRTAQTTNTGLTGAQNKYAIDQGITGEKTTAADREAGRASNLAGTELTNVANRTTLIGSTGKDEDEALKYLLGLKAEKQNLSNLGAKL